MQVGYSYNGEPEITLIIDIPKMRDQVLEPKAVYMNRINLYSVISSIGEASKENPDAYATALFKAVREKYDTIVLVAVVFAIQHETGRSVLTYTSKDVVR